MEEARKARKFDLSDSIRAELNAAGILVENVKGGVRWKRR
jgi:cysteinyl-tRNA synthetase